MRMVFAPLMTMFVLSLCHALHADEPAPGTLQSLFDESQRLAADPATQDEAIQQLNALVKRHQSDSKLYDKALLQLFRHYIDTGRGEDAAQLTADTMAYKQGQIQDQSFGRLIEEVRRKFPQECAKVAAEQKQNSFAQQVLRPSPAQADLAQQILQRRDPALREQALAKVRDWLQPEAGAQSNVAAMAALWKANSAKFDHESFRPLVLPLLKSADANARLMAVTCLPGISKNREDIAALLPLLEDPSPRVRAQLVGALISLGGGEAADVVAPALIKLLQDENSDVVHNSLRSMWGQYHTPELNELLITLSNEPAHHHVAIYHGLSTQPDKSVAVCQRLVEELADPDWNNSGRAAWGLTYGVRPEAAELVEKGLLAALPEETNAYTRREEFQALRQVATEKSRVYLEQVAKSETETDESRQQAQEILAMLDAKR